MTMAYMMSTIYDRLPVIIPVTEKCTDVYKPWDRRQGCGHTVSVSPSYHVYHSSCIRGRWRRKRLRYVQSSSPSQLNNKSLLSPKPSRNRWFCCVSRTPLTCCSTSPIHRCHLCTSLAVSLQSVATESPSLHVTATTPRDLPRKLTPQAVKQRVSGVATTATSRY